MSFFIILIKQFFEILCDLYYSNSESINAKLSKGNTTTHNNWIDGKIKNKIPIQIESTIPKSLAFKLAGVLETSTRTINKNIKRNTGSQILTSIFLNLSWI